MSKRRKPKNGERYFYLEPTGKVWGTKWDDVTFDKNVYHQGNCFRTKAEAEAAAEKVRDLLISLHDEQPTTECNQLPDWCAVGNWVWSTVFNMYFRVNEINSLFVEGKDLCGTSCSCLLGNLRQARLRPYNKVEMKALVGKVIEVERGQFSLCLRVKGLWADFLDECCSEDDCARIVAYSCDMLKSRNTIDGSPCGVLEHFENGEWAK